MKSQKRRRNNKASRQGGSKQAVDQASNRLPRCTAPVQRIVYNPTWNPQALKIARTFQYSAPLADVTAGFGKVYDFELTTSATLLTYNSTAYTFTAADIFNALELGSLFDQWRIAAVKLRFDYISASSSVLNSTGQAQQCTLMAYEDYDDSTPPAASNTGWQQVYESGRAVRRVFPSVNNYMEYVLKPKYLVADVDNLGTTTGRSLASGFIDGATTYDVIWRGLKIIGQANPSPVVESLHRFRITATYFMEYKSRQ